jgi:tRNA-specific 2-thiouridylase
MPKTTASPDRVVVAMSGGVDSSVAAALLQKEGLAVVGLTMRLYDRPGTESVPDGPGIDRGEEARYDAGRIAEILGIPFHTADLRRTFERTVVAEFIAEYNRGRTPNPCLRCNPLVKFDSLLRRAAELGAGRIATGHYARVDFDGERRRWRLKKAVDSDKDQSYFLYGLGQLALSRTRFPLGGLRKPEVREIARRFGLPAAERPESQEICFIPDDDYAAFLRRRIPETFRPGKIVDGEGREIGRHSGFLHFTVGQRKGMGIAAAHPLYVVSLDAASNTVVAGPNEVLFRKSLVAENINWVSVAGLEGSTRAEVKIRSRHEGAAATLRPAGEGAVAVEFDEPQRAITPGQAAVFYDGDTVLGGGIIGDASLNP